MSLTPIDYLTPIAYVYLFSNKLTENFLQIFNNEIKMVLLLLGYTLIRGSFSDSPDLPFFYSNMTLVFEVLPISFFLAAYCYDHKIDPDSSNKRLINSVISVAIIAAAITFFLILNPAISFILNNVILRTNDFVEAATHRCFGLSASLTYSYAIAQGIVAAIVLYKLTIANARYQPFYASTFVLLFIAVIFNARTGMIPILLMVFYLIAIQRNKRFVLASIGLLFMLYLVLYNSKYSEYFEENLSWSMQFFSETSDFILNDRSGGTSPNTYEVLLSDMIIVPDTIGGWIWGTGKNIYTESDKTSDVGYILQLYFGGLLYVGILLALVRLMYKRITLCSNLRWFGFLFLATTLSCNIKGYFIYNDVAFRLLILLYVGFVYYDSIGQANSATNDFLGVIHD